MLAFLGYAIFRFPHAWFRPTDFSILIFQTPFELGKNVKIGYCFWKNINDCNWACQTLKKLGPTRPGLLQVPVQGRVPVLGSLCFTIWMVFRTRQSLHPSFLCILIVNHPTTRHVQNISNVWISTKQKIVGVSDFAFRLNRFISRNNSSLHLNGLC